jgi:hypothetical protein
VSKPRAHAGAGVAMVGLSLVVFAAAAAQPAVAQPTTPPTSLELFEAMMPVFQSDRCVNCHGAVNPETGDEHAGGAVPGFHVNPLGGISLSQTCFACHTEGTSTTVRTFPADPTFGTPATTERVIIGPWILAPRDMSFVGKGAAAVCHQVREMTGDGTGRGAVIMHHLSEDERIDMAFEGMRGIDDSSPEWPVDAEPPPMSKADFLAAAARWIGEGGMGCGPGWSGTLTYTHTISSSILKSDNQGSFNTEMHEADTTTVQVSGGQATATRAITHYENLTQHQPQRGQCQPGAKMTLGSWDFTRNIHRQGSTSATVPFDVAISAGQYQIISAMPQPQVIETQVEHTTRKVCGPDNKLAGLLPGSGPDIDKTTTTTHDFPASSDLISIGATGTLNPDDPDTLSGDVIQPGSTDDDKWETTWHLSRN